MLAPKGPSSISAVAELVVSQSCIFIQASFIILSVIVAAVFPPKQLIQLEIFLLDKLSIPVAQHIMHLTTNQGQNLEKTWLKVFQVLFIHL